MSVARPSEDACTPSGDSAGKKCQAWGYTHDA
jgi:hypothetical protein